MLPCAWSGHCLSGPCFRLVPGTAESPSYFRAYLLATRFWSFTLRHPFRFGTFLFQCCRLVCVALLPALPSALCIADLSLFLFGLECHGDCLYPFNSPLPAPHLVWFPAAEVPRSPERLWIPVSAGPSSPRCLHLPGRLPSVPEWRRSHMRRSRLIHLP